MKKVRLKPSEIVLTSLFSVVLFVAYNRYWRTTRRIEEEKVVDSIAQVRIKSDTDAKAVEMLATMRVPASTVDSNAKAIFERYLRSNDKVSKIVAELANQPNDPFALSRMAFEDPSKVGTYSKTAINLEAESNFVSIGKFLERLEDSPLLTEVESIEISRVKSDLKLCAAKIRLYSYVGRP